MSLEPVHRRKTGTGDEGSRRVERGVGRRQNRKRRCKKERGKIINVGRREVEEEAEWRKGRQKIQENRVKKRKQKKKRQEKRSKTKR